VEFAGLENDGLENDGLDVSKQQARLTEVIDDKTSLVDALDHCLGEMEPAAGNGYIAEHGLQGCSGCFFEVCHAVITAVNARNLRLSCHCFILALLIAVVDFSQTCLLLTYVQSVIFQSVIFQSCKFQSCKFSYPQISSKFTAEL